MSDDFDRQLGQRLRAYESRIPDELPPDPGTILPRRRFGWPLAVAGAGTVVAAAVLAAVVINAQLTGVGQASATPSASAHPTPTDSALPIETRAPTATPTPTPTAMPEPASTAIPTIAPPTGWSPVFRTDGEGGAIVGVAEARGRLFALGQTAPTQPAIWTSDDGVTWAATSVPPIADQVGPGGASGQLGGSVRDLVDAGDRLVAVATLGLAEGSGIFGTMIYISEDGLNWREVRDTPGITNGGRFDLIRVDDRLHAVGASIWTSEDRGLSWTETVDRESVAATLFSIDALDGTVVAVGDGSTGDVTYPPAVAMISTNGGASWTRQVIDADGNARAIAIMRSGRIIVAGYLDQELVAWISDDVGTTWRVTTLGQYCCPHDLVATPTGLVMSAWTPTTAGVLMSTDGITWTDDQIGTEIFDLEWGSSFGLAGADLQNDSILLGPAPAP